MLSWLFGPSRVGAADEDDGWFFRGLRSFLKTRAGVKVHHDSALNYSAVFCATRILAETIGGLPLPVYQDNEAGDKQKLRGHRVHQLLNVAPNAEAIAVAFREGRTMYQVNWGDSYAEIEWDPSRRIVLALWPIHPSRVEPRRDRSGHPVYLVKASNPANDRVFAAADILHIPGALSTDGRRGQGVLTRAMESVGFAMAVEQHGANFFGKGQRPQGVLTVTGPVNDPKVREQTRKEWRSQYGDEKTDSEIAILGNGTTFNAITIPNDTAQFLETRKHNVNEFARWYRLPAHMLGDLERATHSNIEQQSIEFVVYSLLPWALKQEQEINRKLFTPEEQAAGLYVEHNFAGLLRGDIKARYEAYKIALANGWMTVNEVRRLEGLPSIGPRGDIYFAPMNMTTIDMLIEGRNLKGGTQEPGAGEGDEDPPPPPKAKRLAKVQEKEVPTVEEILALPAPSVSASADAARQVLTDTLQRMVAIECNAVRRAIKRKEPAAGWLDRFYASHRKRLTAALPPAIDACLAAGIDVCDLTETVDYIEAVGRNGLQGAADAEALAALADQWEQDRVRDLLDVLLPTDNPTR